MRIYKFNKKNRLGVTVSLLITVMIPMACLGVAGTCIAAQDDCQKLLSKKTFKTLAKDKIKQIQVSLVATGYDPKEIDGIIGPHSKASLTRFCVDFAKAFSKDSVDDFIATLLRYAALAEKEPQWKKIVLNENFESWINQKPAAKRAEFQKTMSSGTPENIISLFEKYLSDREKSTEEIPASKFERSNQYVVSYQLTESDLAQLRSKEDSADKLEELKGISFAGQDEFIKALRKALAPKTYEVDQYQDIIIDLARAQGTYTLTQTSLENLKKENLKKENLPDSVLQDLQKLQNTEFLNEDEFASALQPILDKVRDEFNKYQPLIIKAAEVPRTYTLTKKSLEILKEKGLPDNLLGKLEESKDKTFADKTEFITQIQPYIEEVTIEYNFPEPILTELSDLQTEGLAEQRQEAQKIIEKVKEQYKKYQDLILEQVQILPGYRLTDQTYNELKSEDKLKSKDKLNSEEALDFLNKRLKRPKIEKFSDENQFKAALNAKIDDLINQYQSQIKKQAEKLGTYELTDLALNKIRQKLKTKEIPEAIINVLQEDLQDVGYANAYLFKKALGAKINTLYQSIILSHSKSHSKDNNGFKLTTEALAKIDNELKGAMLPSGMQELFQDQKAKAEYDDKNQFKNMLYEKIKPFIIEPVNFQNQIAQVAQIARKEHPLDVKPGTIDWSGNNCGCVLDELSDVTVYGFYPFWLSKNDESEKKKVPQQLDFSVLSRIGYYALPVDDRGRLKQEDAWNRDAKARFIKTAKRYKTKVDLVIYKVNWKDWIESGDIDDFAAAIVGLAKLKKDRFRISDWIDFVLTTFPWNWTKNYNRIAMVADGITINFDGYPSGPNSKTNFLELITKLKLELNKVGQDFHLNLMVPRDAIGVDIFNYEDLTKILLSKNKTDKTDKNEDFQVNMLVLLEEPPTQSKKALRAHIEAIFHGDERQKILKRIVPVITYDGQDKKQLYDDILYCKENFGGIGFWPLPIGKSRKAEEISEAVKSAFSIKYENMSTVKKAVALACKFICPNRWVFRISLDVFFLTLACSILLYLLNCKFRNFYNSSRKIFWILMGVLLLLIGVGLSLLYCDPYYKNLREGNWPFFIVVAILIGMTVWRYYQRVRRAKNP